MDIAEESTESSGMMAAEHYLCLGCGTWLDPKQASAQVCIRCESTQLRRSQDVGRISGDGSADRADITRVQVDIELRSDRPIAVGRLHTARLAPDKIQQIIEPREKLDGIAKEYLKDGLEKVDWVNLRIAVRNHLTEALGIFLKNYSLGYHPSFPMDVNVSFRLLVLDPEMCDVKVEHAWVEVVKPAEAIASAAKNLKRSDVKIDLQESRLSLDEGGERLRLSISLPVEALVEKMTLASSSSPDEPLEEIKESAFLRSNVMMPLLDQRLSAQTLRSLASKSGVPNEAALAALHVHIRGMDAAIPIEVECGDLGAPDRMVDAFLDVGSTTTKYIFRVAGQLEAPAVKSTVKLVDEWSLPAYAKARFLEDSTGQEWAKWATSLLVALRGHVGRKFGGYLRSIYLTLPQSDGLDVSGLNGALVASSANRLEPATWRFQSPSLRALKGYVKRETVGQAEDVQALVLVPEHEAVAKFYLEPLKALHQMALAYRDSHDTLEKARAEWDRKWSAKREYDSRIFLMRLFTTTPASPGGTRPEAQPSPAEWMRKLIDSPEKLEHVVLLDAGGLSLDMAVLESNEMVAECSRSDAACGGERVSAELGERLGWQDVSSSEATGEKAALGQIWHEQAGTIDIPLDKRFDLCGNGRDHKAYREVTRSIYEPTIKGLADSLAGRWKPCTVILTGGGSRNPHLQELVFECMRHAGLEADVVDAQCLQELLNEASRFSIPLALQGSPSVELFITLRSSPPVSLFTTIHDMASKESLGSKHMAYDKYAVVGGMLAVTNMQKL